MCGFQSQGSGVGPLKISEDPYNFKGKGSVDPWIIFLILTPDYYQLYHGIYKVWLAWWPSEQCTLTMYTVQRKTNRCWFITLRTWYTIFRMNLIVLIVLFYTNKSRWTSLFTWKFPYIHLACHQFAPFRPTTFLFRPTTKVQNSSEFISHRVKMKNVIHSFVICICVLPQQLIVWMTVNKIIFRTIGHLKNVSQNVAGRNYFNVFMYFFIFESGPNFLFSARYLVEACPSTCKRKKYSK